jgi:hypothetical protein
MTGVRNAYRRLFGNPEGKDHVGDTSIGGSIILKSVLKE